MPSDRAAQWLADIVDAIDEITGYVRGISDLTAFEADRRTCRAVERCIEIVCEAARRLGPEVEAVCPDQPWVQIRGMGNRLRHEYGDIGTVVRWGVVVNDLPNLREASVRALERLGR
jgi:uncharacterized protein with HEPN domain